MTIIEVKHADKQAFSDGCDKCQAEGIELTISKAGSNAETVSYKVTGSHKALFFLGIYYNEFRSSLK